MSTATVDTSVEASAAALAGTWELDSAHSTVSFVTRHLKFSKVRGSFRNVTVEATIAAEPAESRVHATIETASVDTGNEQRDGHLRSADFFDVEKYPSMEFTTTAVEPDGEARYRVTGDLTLHGVTAPVELRVEFLGTATDPYGRDKIGFAATGKIDRETWGLTWNQALETGGFLVSRDVEIEVDGQLVRRAD